jgi:hypothetical protein
LNKRINPERAAATTIIRLSSKNKFTYFFSLGYLCVVLKGHWPGIFLVHNCS